MLWCTDRVSIVCQIRAIVKIIEHFSDSSSVGETDPPPGSGSGLRSRSVPGSLSVHVLFPLRSHEKNRTGTSHERSFTLCSWDVPVLSPRLTGVHVSFLVFCSWFVPPPYTERLFTFCSPHVPLGRSRNRIGPLNLGRSRRMVKNLQAAETISKESRVTLMSRRTVRQVDRSERGEPGSDRCQYQERAAGHAGERGERNRRD